VSFSPDGKEIAGGGGYNIKVEGGTRTVGEAGVWELGTGKLRLSKTDLPSAVRCIAFSPNGRLLAEGSFGPIRRQPGGSWVSSELRWWDARTGDLLQTVEGKLGEVNSLAFSPDGNVILWCDGREVVLTATDTGVRRATVMKVTERIINEKD
jgi:WD40 repeat protein